MAKRNIRRETAPSEGERIAMGGYVPQYDFSAGALYRELHAGRLEWFRIADPTAGRVDDIQIATPLRLDAYQVKWAREGGTFTWTDLVAQHRKSPPLISQLADGWSRLTSANPNRGVNVHLVTNQVPSTSPDRSRLAAVRPGTWTFAQFIRRAWDFSKQHGSIHLPGWESHWAKLRELCGFDADTFLEFVKHCSLTFGYVLPTSEYANDDTLLADVRTIAALLPRLIADPIRLIEIDYIELLRRLGWRDRIGLLSTHEFREPAIPYQEITHTADRLRTTLDTLTSGYVALLGTPGSGKSTLLTKTLTASMHRVIRYYAYAPDDEGPRTLRGESGAFLHDIVTTLQQAGFYSGDSLSDRTRRQLQPRLLRQLALLGKDWEENGRKTVILVDGLDHIPRELRPDRSLLLDLPPPDQVPPGVLIVLGTQTTQLVDLPTAVLAQLEVAERRIEIEPLSSHSVREIISTASLPTALTPDALNAAVAAVDGHPLAVSVLLSQLKDADSDETASQTIAHFTAWHGSIDNFYLAHWRQIEEPAFFTLRVLLGQLARLRGSLDLRWIQTWTEPAAIDLLRRRFSHFFIRESSFRWYFFHNSFRQFILRKTAELPPDGFDESTDRRCYAQLADLCQKDSTDSPHAWQCAYLRHAAGQDESVLDVCNANTMRAHMLALRPLDSILDDITLALRIAIKKRDVNHLVRLAFLRAEFDARQNGLDWGSASLCDWLLHTGEIDLACRHARDGTRLCVTDSSALSFSLKLLQRGFHQEARRLFGMSEPLTRLKESAVSGFNLSHHSIEEYHTWAEVAVAFRPLDEVLQLIRSSRLRVERRYPQPTTDEDSRAAFQNSLLYHAGVGAANLGRWLDTERVVAELTTGSHRDYLMAFSLLYQACISQSHVGLLADARRNLLRARSIVPIDHWDEDIAMSLAELTFRIENNASEAARLIKGISQPPLQEHASKFTAFDDRFRLNRLLFAIGDNRSAVEVIPDASTARQQIQVYFERGIVEIARLHASAWRGERKTGAAVVESVKLLLRFFSRDVPDDLRTEWSLMQDHASRFFGLLIRAASLHDNAIPLLANAFEIEWSGSRKGWPAHLIRKIVSTLFEYGMDREWCARSFHTGTAPEDFSGDAADRVRIYGEMIDAELEFGDVPTAQRLIREAIRVAGGVGHRKDPQLDEWAEWMHEANTANPENAESRIRKMISWLRAFSGYAEPRSATAAGEVFMVAVSNWNLVCATNVAWSIAEYGALDFEDGLSLILKAAAKGRGVWRQCEAIASHVLFRIATSEHGAVLEGIIRAAYRDSGREEAELVARRLLCALAIHALPSCRAELRRGVSRGLQAMGLDAAAFGVPLDTTALDDDDQRSTLQLSDGRVLSREQVRALIKSPRDFESLRDSATRFTGYDWAASILPLIREWPTEDVALLASTLTA